MYTVEKISSSTDGQEKSAAVTNSRRACEAIMKQIYDENPGYWPHGLSVDAHDGGVYMIREASTHTPIGFTGWQEREEDGYKVGYYSIGILPAYRNNGYAKQAVAKLINIKSAGVDKVRALIKHDNKPSLALADALHVPVVKAAMTTTQKTLAALGIGTGTAGFMDALTFGRDKSWDEYKKQPITTARAANAVLNMGLGAASMVPGLSPSTRATMLSSIPFKDFALAATPAVPSIAESLKHTAEQPPQKGLLESLSSTQKAVGAGAGLAGLLGAGYLGYKGVQSLGNMANAQQAAAGGRIRVALPTSDPNDRETELDMPMDNLEVSNTQLSKLQRDLRRRIRREGKERTLHRSSLLGNMLQPKEASVSKSSVHKIQALINIIYG